MPTNNGPGKTPVTIITGFLGAGKTTLLNYILKEKGSRSIAVIENEFGEVNIDRELVAANLLAKEDLVSLENGCVCCSLRKDIVKAFAEIERRSRGTGKKVDAIVLETTGLADPAPVAFTFFANPWIASRFRLDSIICVVDARYLMQHLEDGKHSDGTVNEAVQQIAFADLILLNKIDLVKDEVQKKQVLTAIRAVNNSARIVECQLNQDAGRPPMDMLLFNNLFSVNRVLEQIDPQFLDSDSDSDEDEEAQPSPQPNTPGEQVQRPAAGSEREPGKSGSCGAAASAAARTAAGFKPTGEPEAQADGFAGGSQSAAAAGGGTGTAADEAAARTAGEAGPSDSVAGGTAAKLLSKYGLAGHKHDRDELDCEDNCEECHIVEGMPIKGERRPKRRAKRLHDLSDVSSVGILARGPLDEYRFNMYMRDLLAEKAKDIFRCKGVLSVHGYGSTKFVFQGVHETICYGPAEQPWKPDEQRMNQVVFIGRGLDRKALIEGFRTCVWVPLPDGWDEFRDTTTKQPFYVNRLNGEKSWTRPEIACARVVATQGNTRQPSELRPKRQPSSAGQLAVPVAVLAAAAATNGGSTEQVAAVVGGSAEQAAPFSAEQAAAADGGSAGQAVASNGGSAGQVAAASGGLGGTLAAAPAAPEVAT